MPNCLNPSDFEFWRYTYPGILLLFIRFWFRGSGRRDCPQGYEPVPVHSMLAMESKRTAFCPLESSRWENWVERIFNDTISSVLVQKRLHYLALYGSRRMFIIFCHRLSKSRFVEAIACPVATMVGFAQIAPERRCRWLLGLEYWLRHRFLLHFARSTAGHELVHCAQDIRCSLLRRCNTGKKPSFVTWVGAEMQALLLFPSSATVTAAVFAMLLSPVVFCQLM